jgi:hypothetical protein
MKTPNKVTQGIVESFKQKLFPSKSTTPDKVTNNKVSQKVVESLKQKV